MEDPLSGKAAALKRICCRLPLAWMTDRKEEDE